MYFDLFEKISYLASSNFLIPKKSVFVKVLERNNADTITSAKPDLPMRISMRCYFRITLAHTGIEMVNLIATRLSLSSILMFSANLY